MTASSENRVLAQLRPGTRIAAERSVWTLSHRKADESGWWNTDKSGFADVALREGLTQGSLVILDEPPDQGERPEIIYVTGHDTADCLRSLAENFENDDDLVLIGLWNIEPPEGEYPEAYLQVVVTHLASGQSGRTEDPA